MTQEKNITYDNLFVMKLRRRWPKMQVFKIATCAISFRPVNPYLVQHYVIEAIIIKLSFTELLHHQRISLRSAKNFSFLIFFMLRYSTKRGFGRGILFLRSTNTKSWSLKPRWLVRKTSTTLFVLLWFYLQGKIDRASDYRARGLGFEPQTGPHSLLK